MRYAASLLLLLAPLTAQAGQAEPPAKVDFQKQIAPILVSRCVQCHGPEEQEGDLRLDARAHLFIDGEEDDWLVIPNEPGDSELLRRVGLPLDDDEIMPAKGEPLSKAQQDLIAQWIKEGAVWPPVADEWIKAELAAQVLPKITFELPALDEAATKNLATAIERLRATGAVVQVVAADTDAIEVNLSLLRDKITDRELALLTPLAQRLVWLNASRTAISDDAAQHLATLTQLRRLNVANTKLTDSTFQALQPLQHLEHLNAYGTGLSNDGLPTLAALPKLQRLYAWQTKVDKAGVQAITDHLAKVQVDLGDYVEERLAAAQKEIDERAARNKPINDICPVLDKPVDPALTVEHEGRRIAFCCKKCQAKFEKDPAAYAAKLPPLEPKKGEPKKDGENKPDTKPPADEKKPGDKKPKAKK